MTCADPSHDRNLWLARSLDRHGYDWETAVEQEDRTINDECTWRGRRSASPRPPCTRRAAVTSGPGWERGDHPGPDDGLERRVLGAAALTVIGTLVVALRGAW
jgi:hypothetical protein